MTTDLVTTGNASTIALSDKAKRYARKSKSENTLRAYRSAWKEFEHFVAMRGEKALPATPTSVVDYATLLADRGAKVSTIEVKLSAIAWAHRTAGKPDPTAYEVVRAVMAGIRRELKRSPNKREPATLSEVQAMIGTLGDGLKGRRDKAILLVGLAGAFRRSELVALDIEDLRFNDRLTILVRQSKTDQEGEGQVKTIPKIGGELCPVQALVDWLDIASINSGAVFRRVDRHGKAHDRLAAQSVALVIKKAAKAAGLDWRSFSGHSLRSGFITEAMDAGVSDSDIMQQTGHRNNRTMREYRKSTGAGASRAVRAVFGEGPGQR